MAPDISHLIEHLEQLLKDAENPKILWEEMQLISKKAFELQEEILSILDARENTETDVARLQAVFDKREQVWDIMNRLAVLELTLKEKTFKKGGKIKKTGSQNHSEQKACSCTHAHCHCQQEEDTHTPPEHKHCCCCEGKKKGGEQ